MKKQRLIFLFILMPIMMHGMNNECESKFISGLKNDITNFEKQLWEDIFIFWSYIPPTLFMSYCYYQKHDLDRLERFNRTRFNRAIQIDNLKSFHEQQLMGYSCLGATMIARNASIQERRMFIQELIDLDFKSSEKDVILAKLILYDTVTAEKTVVQILNYQSQSNWSMLPSDVRKYIAHYLIELFKKEAWLLPEKNVL